MATETLPQAILCRRLKPPPEYPAKHIYPDPLTLRLALCLVLRVRRYLYLTPLDPPATRPGHELHKVISP